MKDTKLWDKRYQELKEYKLQHGDTNVPRRFESNPQLGVWVSNQRQYYKKFKTGISGWGMTESRIKRLENIGFEWALVGGRGNSSNSSSSVGGGGGGSSSTSSTSSTTSNSSNNKNSIVGSSTTSTTISSTCSKKSTYESSLALEWDNMYEKLVAYRHFHGNANVPEIYKDDQNLADWVDIQKEGLKRYKANKANKANKAPGMKCSDEYRGMKMKMMTLDRFQLLLKVGLLSSIDFDDMNLNMNSEMSGDAGAGADADADVDTGAAMENTLNCAEHETSSNRTISLKQGMGTSTCMQSFGVKRKAQSDYECTDNEKRYNNESRKKSNFNSNDDSNEEDNIFFEAVAASSSGNENGATLDSVAEFIFRKFAKRKKHQKIQMKM